MTHPWDDPRSRPDDQSYSDYLGVDPRGFGSAEDYYQERSMRELIDRDMAANGGYVEPGIPATSSRSIVSTGPTLPAKHGIEFCGAACDCRRGCIPATPDWIAEQQAEYARRQERKAAIWIVAVVALVLAFIVFKPL